MLCSPSMAGLSLQCRDCVEIPLERTLSVFAGFRCLFSSMLCSPSMAGLSLQCRDCVALMKSVEEALEHAEITSHTNFADSTEAVLNLLYTACGKPSMSITETDLHTKRTGTGYTDFVDKTVRWQNRSNWRRLRLLLLLRRRRMWILLLVIVRPKAVKVYISSGGSSMVIRCHDITIANRMD